MLKGGHVIGPKNGIDAVRDVGIRVGRIAAVQENPPSSAIRIVPNSGPARKPAIVFAAGKGKSFAAAEAEQLAAKGCVAMWLTIKRAPSRWQCFKIYGFVSGQHLTVVKPHGGEL